MQTNGDKFIIQVRRTQTEDMKKLYQKEPIWFAVLWIVIYVVCFSAADGISESMGMPKLITALAGLLLSIMLIGFIRREDLMEHFGLCGFRGSKRDFLFFIPLIVISSVNLWNGLQLQSEASEAILSVISMCFVAVLEEVVFRGLLFKGMSRDNLRIAVIVSSLTFGFGHIVNLLLGEPIFETLLQLVYASAVGFCFTAVFIAGGSIVPCILSHAAVNCLSIFAVQPSDKGLVLIAAVQTVISILYGVWLLKRHSTANKQTSA